MPTGRRATVSSFRSEREFLDAIVDLAMYCRWAVHHDLPARRAGAQWRTSIQGHRGFPDLVLARGVVLFREVKMDKGRLSPEQVEWARQLSGDPHWVEPARAGARYVDRLGLVFDVWRPADMLGLIVPTLRAPRTMLTNTH